MSLMRDFGWFAMADEAVSVGVESDHILELRSEVMRTVAVRDASRRGLSDTLVAGCESALDSVSGSESVEIRGSLTERIKHHRMGEAEVAKIHIDGKLKMHSHSETTLVGGAMSENHIGPALLLAGMSDDMVIGGGARVTGPVDITMAGLLGMEQKIATGIADGLLTEMGILMAEREFGPGVHAYGAVIYQGMSCVTQATGFMPLMRTWHGIRNLTPGAGAGEGGGGASSPNGPAGPPPAGAVEGAMLAGQSAGSANGTGSLDDVVMAAERSGDITMASEDAVLAGEDASDTRQISRAQALEEAQNLTAPADESDAVTRVSVTEESSDAATVTIRMETVDDGQDIRLQITPDMDDQDWMTALNDPVDLSMDSHFMAESDLEKASDAPVGTWERAHFEVAQRWRVGEDANWQEATEVHVIWQTMFNKADEAMTEGADPMDAAWKLRADLLADGRNAEAVDPGLADLTRTMAIYYPQMMEAPEATESRAMLVYNRNMAVLSGDLDQAADLQKHIDQFDLDGTLPLSDSPLWKTPPLPELPDPSLDPEAQLATLMETVDDGQDIRLQIVPDMDDQDWMTALNDPVDLSMDSHFMAESDLEKASDAPVGTWERAHFEVAQRWRVGEDANWQEATEVHVIWQTMFNKADEAMTEGADPMDAAWKLRADLLADGRNAEAVDPGLADLTRTMAIYYPQMMEAPEATESRAMLVYNRNMAVLSGDLDQAADLQKHIDQFDLDGTLPLSDSPLWKTPPLPELPETQAPVNPGVTFSPDDPEVRTIDPNMPAFGSEVDPAPVSGVLPSSGGSEAEQISALDELEALRGDLASKLKEILPEDEYRRLEEGGFDWGEMRTAFLAPQMDNPDNDPAVAAHLSGLAAEMDQMDSGYSYNLSRYVDNAPNAVPLSPEAIRPLGGAEDGPSVSDKLKDGLGNAVSYLEDVQDGSKSPSPSNVTPDGAGGNYDAYLLVRDSLPVDNDRILELELEQMRLRQGGGKKKKLSRKKATELSRLRTERDLQIDLAADTLKMAQADLDSGLDPLARIDTQIANYMEMGDLPVPDGELSFQQKADVLKRVRQSIMDVAGFYDSSGVLGNVAQTGDDLNWRTLDNFMRPPAGDPPQDVPMIPQGVADIPVDEGVPPAAVDSFRPQSPSSVVEPEPDLVDATANPQRYDFTTGNAVPDTVPELALPDSEPPPAVLADLEPEMIPIEEPPGQGTGTAALGEGGQGRQTLDIDGTDAETGWQAGLDETGAGWRYEEPTEAYDGPPPAYDGPPPASPDPSPPPPPEEPVPDFGDAWERLNIRRQSGSPDALPDDVPSAGLDNAANAHLDQTNAQIHELMTELVEPHAAELGLPPDELATMDSVRFPAEENADATTRLRNWFQHFIQEADANGEVEKAAQMRATLASFDRLTDHQVSSAIVHADSLSGLSGVPLSPGIDPNALSKDLYKKAKNAQRDVNTAAILNLGTDEAASAAARADALRLAEAKAAEGMNPVSYLVDMRRSAELEGNEDAIKGIDDAIRDVLKSMGAQDPDFRKPPAAGDDTVAILEWRRNEAMYGGDLDAMLDFQQQIDAVKLDPDLPDGRSLSSLDAELMLLDQSHSAEALEVAQKQNLQSLIDRRIAEIDDFERPPDIHDVEMLYEDQLAEQVDHMAVLLSEYEWPATATDPDLRRAELESQLDALMAIRMAQESGDDPLVVLGKMRDDAIELYGLEDPRTKGLDAVYKYQSRVSAMQDIAGPPSPALLLAQSEIANGRDPRPALRALLAGTDPSSDTHRQIQRTLAYLDTHDWADGIRTQAVIDIPPMGATGDGPPQAVIDIPLPSPADDNPPPKPPRARPDMPRMDHEPTMVLDDEVQHLLDAVPSPSSLDDAPPPKPPRVNPPPSDPVPIPEDAQHLFGSTADGTAGTVRADDAAASQASIMPLDSAFESLYDESGLMYRRLEESPSDTLYRATSSAANGEDGVDQRHVQGAFDQFIDATDEATGSRKDRPLPALPEDAEPPPPPDRTWREKWEDDQDWRAIWETDARDDGWKPSENWEDSQGYAWVGAITEDDQSQYNSWKLQNLTNPDGTPRWPEQKAYTQLTPEELAESRYGTKDTKRLGMSPKNALPDDLDLLQVKSRFDEEVMTPFRADIESYLTTRTRDKYEAHYKNYYTGGYDTFPDDLKLEVNEAIEAQIGKSRRMNILMDASQTLDDGYNPLPKLDLELQLYKQDAEAKRATMPATYELMMRQYEQLLDVRNKIAGIVPESGLVPPVPQPPRSFADAYQGITPNQAKRNAAPQINEMVADFRQQYDGIQDAMPNQWSISLDNMPVMERGPDGKWRPKRDADGHIIYRTQPIELDVFAMDHDVEGSKFGTQNWLVMDKKGAHYNDFIDVDDTVRTQQFKVGGNKGLSDLDRMHRDQEMIMKTRDMVINAWDNAIGENGVDPLVSLHNRLADLEYQVGLNPMPELRDELEVVQKAFDIVHDTLENFMVKP